MDNTEACSVYVINQKTFSWRRGCPCHGKELNPFSLELPIPVDTGVEGERALLSGRVRRAHGDAHGLQSVGVGIFHQQHVLPRLGHGQGQLHFHLEDRGMTEGVCAGCPCYKPASSAAQGTTQQISSNPCKPLHVRLWVWVP